MGMVALGLLFHVETQHCLPVLGIVWCLIQHALQIEFSGVLFAHDGGRSALCGCVGTLNTLR